jgi:hypothetical protein
LRKVSHKSLSAFEAFVSDRRNCKPLITLFPGGNMKKFTFIASVLITTFFLFPQSSKADTTIIIKDGTSPNSGVSNEVKKMLQVIKAPRYRNIFAEKNIVGEITRICYEKLKNEESNQWLSGCKTIYYPTESDMTKRKTMYLNALKEIERRQQYSSWNRDVLLERDDNDDPKVCYESRGTFQTKWSEECAKIDNW